MPFVFSINEDSDFEPESGSLEKAILSQVEETPGEHHPTTLTMELAGNGHISADPDYSDFDKVRETCNFLRDYEEHDGEPPIDAEFVDTDEYVETIVAPGGLTPGEALKAWENAEESANKRVPGDETAEDRNLNVVDIRKSVEEAV